MAIMSRKATDPSFSSWRSLALRTLHVRLDMSPSPPSTAWYHPEVRRAPERNPVAVRELLPRGLGCASANEFYKLTTEEVNERNRAAFTRLCKRRKIDPDTLQPWDKVEKMLKKLDRADIVPAESWVATPPKPPPPRPPRPPPPPP
jgi:hypothetical protein